MRQIESQLDSIIDEAPLSRRREHAPGQPHRGVAPAPEARPDLAREYVGPVVLRGERRHGRPMVRSRGGRRRGRGGTGPRRAAPEAISRSQPDFEKRPLSPFKQRVAQARAQELEPIDDDAAAPTCWPCGLGGGAEASDAAPTSVTILDALGFRSDAESAAAS